MNSYGTVSDLKSDSYISLESADTGQDTQLRKIMESASRLIDKYCNRFFYVSEGTRYYAGAGLRLWTDDILSITTIKTDEDGDGTFENTLTVNTDYFLYPLNISNGQACKTSIEINPDGNYGGFALGVQRGVEIIGTFGYGDGYSATPYISTGGTGTVATATGTALTLSASNLVIAGQTILCESEQMYVESVSTTTATVRRGVNGTTGAIHSAKALYIYEYPEPITTACYITTMRQWKRKDSAFQDMVGIPELGQIIVAKGLDSDVKDIINRYMKVQF